jgi:hypothetical protein
MPATRRAGRSPSADSAELKRAREEARADSKRRAAEFAERLRAKSPKGTKTKASTPSSSSSSRGRTPKSTPTPKKKSVPQRLPSPFSRRQLAEYNDGKKWVPCEILSVHDDNEHEEDDYFTIRVGTREKQTERAKLREVHVHVLDEESGEESDDDAAAIKAADAKKKAKDSALKYKNRLKEKSMSPPPKPRVRTPSEAAAMEKAAGSKPSPTIAFLKQLVNMLVFLLLAGVTIAASCYAVVHSEERSGDLEFSTRKMQRILHRNRYPTAPEPISYDDINFINVQRWVLFLFVVGCVAAPIWKVPALNNLFCSFPAWLKRSLIIMMLCTASVPTMGPSTTIAMALFASSGFGLYLAYRKNTGERLLATAGFAVLAAVVTFVLTNWASEIMGFIVLSCLIACKDLVEKSEAASAKSSPRSFRAAPAPVRNFGPRCIPGSARGFEISGVYQVAENDYAAVRSRPVTFTCDPPQGTSWWCIYSADHPARVISTPTYDAACEKWDYYRRGWFYTPPLTVTYTPSCTGPVEFLFMDYNNKPIGRLTNPGGLEVISESTLEMVQNALRSTTYVPIPVGGSWWGW